MKPNRNVKTAAKTEAQLWQAQATTAEKALDFTISFLGCRMGANDASLTADARKRLLTIVRAVSLVESRHGTSGANQPKRDPLQCGNPLDAWWKELTGESGNGSRFIRGPNLNNLWANEVNAKAESFSGFPADASFLLLQDKLDGHTDAVFKPAHSYTWGIIFLIHKINNHSGSNSYNCGNLSRDWLVNGAVTYNGGGVADYKKRLEDALIEIGDPLSLVAEISSASPGMRPAELVGALLETINAGPQERKVRRVELHLDPASGGVRSVAIDFDSSP
ncbi:hypothetical protein GOA89_28900 [Sinorhizobium meliloti]|nr:hypothetical protein [Sinorhizobium meliloti]MDW9850218.1 hypothetical protein [Sinorhizobium meliloti]MDX0146996.1 hypothetical protein [Sinorhizobium meliloti]MDX0153339.1 hypothetical protein [Sinorhizobium meliloti]MDX0172127.1 hypothetical protein [Sinorhizobium meliloti]